MPSKKTERQIEVKIRVIQNAPGCACYRDSNDPEEPQTILVCLRNIAGFAKLDNEDFDGLVQHCLAHELLHAVQDAYGQIFSESQIHAALADSAEMVICEDEAQAEQIQANTEALLMRAVRDLRAAIESGDAAQMHAAAQRYSAQNVADRLNSIIQTGMEIANAHCQRTLDSAV